MIRNEFIGKRIKVVGSSNPSDAGIEGIVVDETKSTFLLDSGKRLIKQNITIEVDGQTIEGEKLAKRPEERIK